MPRIVDGDNLLGRWPGRTRSEADKRRLSHEVDRLARQEGWEIVLVYDGPAPLGVAFGGEVRFAGQGHTADDVVIGHLRGQRDPHGWVVVTDDRSLGNHCRHAGARVESCAVFRARLARGTEEKPAEGDDLAYWKDVFGVDE